MPPRIANTPTRRACDLISALDAKEITVAEFADALRHLPSEVLQISATFLALNSSDEPLLPRITEARRLCATLASVTRSLN